MEQANGGWWTQGCTDGCGGPGTFASAWRCTRGACTGDCWTGNTVAVCTSQRHC